MSTYKRISGDYTIQSVNPVSDRIIINSGNVYIEGNLWVTGNTQTISSINTSLANSVITLNAGATSPNPFGAAIVVNRGSGQSNAEIIWNETVKAWQIGETVNGYYSASNIATGSVVGSFLTAVNQDANPSLGGNLNIGSDTIYSSTNGTILAMTTAPSGGGTGITVSNNLYNNVELINKTKSIVYSIIFG